MLDLDNRLERIRDLFNTGAYDIALEDIEQLKQFVKRIKKNVRRHKK